MSGDQRDAVAGRAIVRVDATGDTTVTVEVTAGSSDAATGGWRPASGRAIRGRDAVQLACVLPEHAVIEPPEAPELD